MIFVKDPPSSNDVSSNGSFKVDNDLHSFLNEHAELFIDDIPSELPPKRGDDDHRIDLIPGSSPPNKPPYRVSQAQQEEIIAQEGWYIQDVCGLSCIKKLIVKNQFPIPNIEDLFDKLQGSTYFSRIDLKSGYHQIQIVPEDIHKTTFRTTFGLYEFLVMSFGLTNAPATFNRMMERIFRGKRAYTGVFFDDIIVYSKSLEEHKEHLKAVFQALQENKLYINRKKKCILLRRDSLFGSYYLKGWNPNGSTKA
ncbi:hypothetical protein L7F22_062874 [Adiantum nelumboides]|nr:hypothetical protein [Adiantum nelumboides]